MAIERGRNQLSQVARFLRRNRPARRVVAAVAVGATALTTLVVVGEPAFAAGETLAVVLDQSDGTAPFDGLDANTGNGVVRVNDTVSYRVEFSVNGAAATDATFTMTLPKGLILAALPAYCTGPGSSLTPSGASIVPPVPLTATSYQALPSQVLTCNVGSRVANSTENYTVTAVMSSEVPNATTLPPVRVSVTTAGAPTPVVSNQTTVTAASQLRWDLSKNGTNVQNDSGPVYGPGATPCDWDNTIGCIIIGYPVTLSAPSQGKGAEPVGSQPITFTDDISAAALFPTLDAGQLAAINANPGKYGARLLPQLCGSEAGAYNEPGMKIGKNPTDTATSSVRDSGTVTCTQPGGPGTAVSVSIANADTSLYTYPTNFKTYGGADGSAIPTTDAYAISTNLTIEIPAATINDFGISSNGVTTLTAKNTFTNLSITGINPNDHQSGDSRPGNDFRTLQPNIRQAGDFNKFFVGNPNDTAINTPPGTFNGSSAVMEGPPGGSTVLSGTINAAPTQTVVSQLAMVGSDISNASNVSILGCDTWDNSKLQLHAGDYQGLKTADPAAGAQYIGSGGQAVWLSGFYGTSAGTGAQALYATDAAQLPAYSVEYGTGPAGAGARSTCNDADSPSGWSSDPATVPGNDPALAAQGIYSAVTRVRVHVNLPVPVTGQLYPTQAYASIALRVIDTATAGEVLPNWASATFSRSGWATQADMLASANWNGGSTYDPGTSIGNGHIGGPGDRLIAAPAFPRITKTVKGPGDADFNSSTPATTGGDTVQYKLAPSLTSAATGGTTGYDVWVEDCLPGSQIFTGASVTPTLVSINSTPADAKIAPCAAGDTYLRWDLGPRRPNANIDPIIVNVAVSITAPDGTYENDVVIWSQDDFSTLKQRSAAAEIQIQSPAGIKLDKVALTPVTQVNRAGQGTNEVNKWLVTLGSVNGPPGLTNPDIIDVLPRQGDAAGTNLHGSFTFAAATVVAGGPTVTLQYTKAAAVNQDPSDASNGAGGATVWCDGPSSSATVVSGAGTAADCPASPAAVTGVRIGRPGAFATGDVITAEIDMVAVDNAAGDVYQNTAFARVAGLQLPVGPVVRPETVQASGVGDFVWLDADKNGQQDAGEAGVDGFPVKITGTDDLGNPVSATTTTAGDGKYRFDSLRAGNYTVTFDPAGLTSTQAFTGQAVAGVPANLNSDGNASTGVTAAIALPANTQDLDIDQGIVSLTRTPTVVTTISSVAPKLGDTLSDSIVVANTGGAAIAGTWQLLGPVAPGADGTCATATWAGAALFDNGPFAVTGDGTHSVSSTKALTAAGCYTFTDQLPATATTDGVVTAPGLPSETGLVAAQIETVISTQTAKTGATLSDTVTVTGVGSGYTGAIRWGLLGPVAAVGGSCTGVDWTGAATFDAGSVPVGADGTYLTTSTKALAAPGCYTFVDTLTTSGTVTAVSSAPGLVSETALVTAATPTVTTTISNQRAGLNAQISDTIAVTGSAGAQVSGTWTLLGPVAAVGGSCTGAVWTGAATAATGTFTVTLTSGAGQTVTPATTVTQAGCYTYVENLDATPASAAVRTSAAGIVAETVLIAPNTPTVATTVSAQSVSIGATLTDQVVVAGTAGPVSATWSLLGPVSPANASCAGVDWTGAAVFDSGALAITGDGTYTTAASKPITQAGCYTYVETLPASANSVAVTTPAGVASETALVLSYAIGDYVWKDANHDGIQDPTEPPVGGVKVSLRDGAGNPVGSSTTTDANGYYHFDDLAAGDYSVVFTAPAGYQFTAINAAGSTSATDSNADPHGASALVHLGPADPDLTPSTAADGVSALFIDRTIDAGLIDLPTPTVLTTVSDQQVFVGATLTDSVVVTGIVTPLTMTWQLLGPVAVVDGSCARADWSHAAVLDSGQIAVAKDGTYATPASKAITAPGCYTYVESLPATDTTLAVTTEAGMPSESTLGAVPPVTPPAPPVVPHVPSLAFTGTDAAGLAGIALALLAGGGLILLVGRRRRAE